MSLLTVAQACAQCRVESDYPSDQIQPYIDGAECAAAAYLNRALFASQDDLDTAMEAVPAQLGQANADYSAAIEAAASLADPLQKQAALDVANAKLSRARAEASTTINGIVANASVLAAVRLTLGQLFTSREDVVVGAAAVELPGGARSLLRPFRRTMMP